MKTGLLALPAIACALAGWDRVLLAWFAWSRQAALLPALISVESGGDPLAVGWKNGDASFGPLQITEAYAIDAGRDWDSLDLTDLDTSIAVFRAYMRKYATRKRLGRIPTIEDYARIHNGGPNGWKLESTRVYWGKVEVAIGKGRE